MKDLFSSPLKRGRTGGDYISPIIKREGVEKLPIVSISAIISKRI